MITFNQLKYNTVCYTLGKTPCIRPLLLLIFLTLSSLLYWLSIKMHESTIFKISGRVDFLEMPLLDKIEEAEKEWKLDNIPKIKKGQNVIEVIMKEHYFQEIPVKITGYADFLELRKDYQFDKEVNDKQEDENFTLNFMDFRNLKHGKTRFNYKFLREQNKELKEGTKLRRFFIYDDEVLTKDTRPDEEKNEDPKIVKNPFYGLFEAENVIYGETVEPFYTMPVKKSLQKFICNIGFTDEKEITGNLNISIVHPLYLRYMYLMDYWTDEYSTFSELDLYNQDLDAGKFPSFEYSRINHATLEPGDCIYIPANWWIQLDNRMDEKLGGSNEPMYEKYLPSDEGRLTNVKWVEYEYTNLSYLEDEALSGLESGYGS